MMTFPNTATVDYLDLSAKERDDLVMIADAMNEQQNSDGHRMPSLFDHPISRN